MRQHVRRVDRTGGSADGDLFTEQTYEFTETDEEAVVAKTARVIEEVVVSKDVTERVETIRDTVRRLRAAQGSSFAIMASFCEPGPLYCP